MSELKLALCPICSSRNSLSRHSTPVQDHEIVWYECRKCSSFLLWAGNDQWIYQKVGRQEKSDLLSRTLTTVELEALARLPAEELAGTWQPANPDEPMWGARVNTTRRVFLSNENRRAKARDYPQWARVIDRDKWEQTGLVVWDHRTQTAAHLCSLHVLHLLNLLRADDTWKQHGFVVGAPRQQLTVGHPDWKAEDLVLDRIALDPSQVQALLNLLAEKESDLARTSAAEEEEAKKALAACYRILLEAAERAKNKPPESADDDQQTSSPT